MPTVRTTPVVRLLLIINSVAFLVQMFADTFFGTHLFEIFGLVPYRVFHHYAVWQPFTYMFLHADMFHILFNMLVLWMIGSELEAQWGPRFFTRFYLVSGMAGAFLYLAVQPFFEGTTAALVPVVGSSGAVYGLLVAYGIIYSERVMLFMMIFPMKAKHFVLVLAAVELVTSVFNSRSVLANLAHLGGMGAGFLYLSLSAYYRIRAKEKKTGKKSRAKRSKHLRLVINNETFKDFDTDDHDGSDDSGRPFSH